LSTLFTAAVTAEVTTLGVFAVDRALMIGLMEVFPSHRARPPMPFGTGRFYAWAKEMTPQVAETVIGPPQLEIAVSETPDLSNEHAEYSTLTIKSLDDRSFTINLVHINNGKRGVLCNAFPKSPMQLGSVWAHRVFTLFCDRIIKVEVETTLGDVVRRFSAPGYRIQEYGCSRLACCLNRG